MSAPPPKEPSLTALLNALDRIAATDYHEVEIRIGATRLRASRGPAAPTTNFPAPAPVAAPAPAPPAEAGPDGGEAAADEAGRTTVTSPMVGAFYRRPRPDAEPFVSPGDRVQPGQVLCIIEAMKLMNNIEAEVAGVVEEVVPEDGAAVQFGDPLFVLRTD